MKRDRIPKTLAEAPALNRADDHRTDLTDAEREARMGTAVHEAAHFVAACRLGLPIVTAFVRVPRKQPKAGFAGALGAVAAGGTLMQDAVFAAAGALAQQFLSTDEEQARKGCKNDWAAVDAWANWTGDWDSGPMEPLSREDRSKFLEAVFRLVSREWNVVDAVAACLLHCADAAGVLSPRLTAELSALVRRTPDEISRIPEFDGPEVCEALRIEGPQIYVSRDYPFVRITAPPNYRSPFLPTA